MWSFIIFNADDHIVNVGLIIYKKFKVLNKIVFYVSQMAIRKDTLKIIRQDANNMMRLSTEA